MKNLVYIWSFRNAAADMAGQWITYKDGLRYMKSPLEYLVELLNETALGKDYVLCGIVFDDDKAYRTDHDKLVDYGFSCGETERWFYPADLSCGPAKVNDLLHSIPSSYRQHPQGSAERRAGKRDFELRLEQKLYELKADVVLLDGLLVILDELIRPGSPFHHKVVNIHPGITREGSPYERRGAHATLDALYAAQGKKVIDWTTMRTCAISPVHMTGASFHYVDGGIDSGEVITDVLQTRINPGDTILELRWNNFNNSLFPALRRGLERMLNGSPSGIHPMPVSWISGDKGQAPQ